MCLDCINKLLIIYFLYCANGNFRTSGKVYNIVLQYQSTLAFCTAVILLGPLGSWQCRVYGECIPTVLWSLESSRTVTILSEPSICFQNCNTLCCPLVFAKIDLFSSCSKDKPYKYMLCVGRDL